MQDVKQIPSIQIKSFDFKLSAHGRADGRKDMTGQTESFLLIPWENQEIGYTAFNKVSSVSEKIGADNYQLDITYGPDRQRWKTLLKKNNVLQKTIIFAGDYEAITENGVTRQLYYIPGGNGLAAVYVKQSGQTDKIYYAFTDHLGSIVKLFDGNGATVFAANYDAWGNRTVTNNTFAFHRGYTGHEHLPEFNLVDMNGRMYDPVLGRFLSPDPFVQAPEFSQSFNRYSYCINNPLRYTDPNGEWWGVDDLLIAGAGFVFGYAGHGLSTGNWGWKAVAAGGIGAGMAWLGYNTAGMATGAITNATWNQVGSIAINTAANQIMPSMYIPMGDHFGLSVSPAFGLGAGGLTGGINMTGVYTNGDFRVAAGIGAGDNYWGWNASADIGGYGLGYGQTTYGATEIQGHQLGPQRVGTYTALWDGGSFSISNDLWGDKRDRNRTSAAELTIGKFSIGTYLYTNDGREASGEKTDPSENCIPPWPVGIKKNGKLQTWTNGRPYSAPFWIGYRNGNQITRIGFSHETVHNLTQNMVHKFMDTPYYMSYDEFKRGGYFYTGYRNPLSLWDR